MRLSIYQACIGMMLINQLFLVYNLQKLLMKDLAPTDGTTNIEEAGCSSSSVNNSRTGTGGIHRHTTSAGALPYICMDNLSAMWNGYCVRKVKNVTHVSIYICTAHVCPYL